jgi:hypothetical protein
MGWYYNLQGLQLKKGQGEVGKTKKSKVNGY